MEVIHFITLPQYLCRAPTAGAPHLPGPRGYDMIRSAAHGEKEALGGGPDLSFDLRDVRLRGGSRYLGTISYVPRLLLK